MSILKKDVSLFEDLDLNVFSNLIYCNSIINSLLTKTTELINTTQSYEKQYKIIHCGQGKGMTVGEHATPLTKRFAYLFNFADLKYSDCLFEMRNSF